MRNFLIPATALAMIGLAAPASAADIGYVQEPMARVYAPAGPLPLQAAGDPLDLAEGPENVLPGQLPQGRLAPAPPGELGEQARVLRNVLEPLHHEVDSVEVPADAHVVDARHVPDVLDMIGHLGQSRPDLRMRGAPGRGVAANARDGITRRAPGLRRR